MNRRRLIIGIWAAFFLWFAPASSGVLAQDAHSQHGTHAADIPEKVFQAKMAIPDEIKPGESFPVDIHIQDDNGRKISEFDIFQEKLMHLILVSEDLGFFGHLHPEHQGSGHFQTTVILPSAGMYTLFSDYKPAGHKEQVSVLKLRVKGKEKSADATDMEITEKIVQDTRVRMRFSPKGVKANEDAHISFDLKQLDGKPITGLGPYLGEKGHLVVIRKSDPLRARDYIHAHAMKDGEASEIRFMTRFPDKGFYKLWCQFNRKGRILTAEFWVNIQQ